MNEKTKCVICQLVNSVLFAGVIVFCIGLYYWIVKAGIPYQDPPLDLQIQYAVHSTIGEILLGMGFQIAVYSSIFRFLLWILWRKKRIR